MAKQQGLSQQDPHAEKADDAFPLSLDEFCARLSQTERRTELIGGFHHQETAAGHLKDLESAYQGRFDQFINQEA